MYRLVRIRASCQYEVNTSVYDSLCVGRGQQNDLWTTDRLVSSAHARFFVRDGVLQLVDLDSRNGTEVNGERLTPFEPAELQRGDTVDIAGRIAFRVDLDEEAAYPTIAVTEPEDGDQEDVLRVLALPDGLAPVLDSGQLLKLHKLIAKLLNPQQQRQGTRWLETLVSGAARLLKVEECHLVTRRSGRTTLLYPESSSAPLREEAVIEAGRRRRTVAVEVSALDLNGLDPHSTVESHRMGPAFIPVIAAPIEVEDELVAFLYACGDDGKGRRSFDEHDVWLIHQLALAAGNMLDAVSSAQIVSRRRHHYQQLVREARELGLVGPSAALAGAVAAVSELADEGEPVLFEGPPGSDPERWARLLHQLSRRSGAAFAVIDTNELRDFEDVESMLASTDGGTVLFLNIDALDEKSRPDLQALLDSGLATRIRFLFSSRYPRELLTGLRGFTPRLVRAISAHAIRIPRICERLEDLVPSVRALAGELEPETSRFFTSDARRRLAETEFDGSWMDLRLLVVQMLEVSAVRPLERSHFDELLAGYPRRDRHSAPSPLPGFHPFERQDDAPAAPLETFVAEFFRAGLLD